MSSDEYRDHGISGASMSLSFAAVQSTSVSGIYSSLFSPLRNRVIQYLFCMQQLFIMQLGYKILAIPFFVHDERTNESGKKR